MYAYDTCMHGGVQNNNTIYTLYTGKKLENRIHSLKPCFIYSEISVDGHLKTPKDFKIKKTKSKIHSIIATTWPTLKYKHNKK